MSKQCVSHRHLAKAILWSALLVFMAINITVAQARHVLVYGDSLSAGYGLDIEQGWVALLNEKLGKQYQVTNASISGETTVGGLARLPATLAELKPDLVILELGANDGLRGYKIENIKANLDQMVTLVQSSGADVMIAGISLPPSYGPRYIDQFRGVFRQLAEEQELPFVDMFIESFVERPGYIQEDGLHPTALGQSEIRDKIFAALKETGLLATSADTQAHQSGE